MRCKVCSNESKYYFVKLKNGYYCKMCCTLKRSFLNRIFNRDLKREIPGKNYRLNFKLTKAQEKISNKLVNLTERRENALVYAICGSGKTEICYKVINFCLNQGYKVGFACPRKDLVNNLYFRIRNSFNSKVKVARVHGESKTELYGDVVVLTTNQLHNYINYFDILIIDEVDAYPFYGNEMLNSIADKCYRINKIYLTATPDKKIFSEFNKKNIFRLFERFHKREVPIPVFLKNKKDNFQNHLLSSIKEGKKVIVFLPSKELTFRFWEKYKNLFRNSYYINSASVDKKRIINMFNKNEYNLLFSTSILERGFTFENLHVIIMFANSKIFNLQTIIQMCGRVDRKIKKFPFPPVLCDMKKSFKIRRAIKITKGYNEVYSV